MSFRFDEIENDFYNHGAPIRLQGGGVEKFIYRGQESVLVDISVPSLDVLQPFRIYSLAIRRHIPLDFSGRLLKFRAITCNGQNPNTFTGTSVEIFNNHGHEVDLSTDMGHDEIYEDGFDGDGYEGDEREGGRCKPRKKVIHTETLARIYDVTMEGLGNSATVDDLFDGRSNQPRPFILFYKNDKDQLVLLKRCCKPRRRRCKPRPEIVRVNTLRTIMPYQAETLEFQSSAIGFVEPDYRKTGQLFVEGGVGSSRGYNGNRWT